MIAARTAGCRELALMFARAAATELGRMIGAGLQAGIEGDQRVQAPLRVPAPVTADEPTKLALRVQVRDPVALELRDHVLQHELPLLQAAQHDLVHVRISYEPRDDLIQVPVLHA